MSKHRPVLAIRYFYADPMTGKEIKGNPSATTYMPQAQARRALAALNKGRRQYLGGLFAKGLAVLILALSAAGCATPNAGQATTSVTVYLGPIGAGATVTVTNTITPTSTAEQKADAKADIKAEIPIK